MAVKVVWLGIEGVCSARNYAFDAAILVSIRSSSMLTHRGLITRCLGSLYTSQGEERLPYSQVKWTVQLVGTSHPARVVINEPG